MGISDNRNEMQKKLLRNALLLSFFLTTRLHPSPRGARPILRLGLLHGVLTLEIVLAEGVEIVRVVGGDEVGGFDSQQLVCPAGQVHAVPGTRCQ